MNRKPTFLSITALCLLLATLGHAQGTLADYERAGGLREKYVGLAVNLAERATWIGQTSRFWYRKAVRGGNEFVLVDAETLAKRPAFDHERLAAALSAAAGEKYTALKLPFQQINFVDNEKAIEFTVGETRWRCELADYTVKKLPPGGPGGFGQRRGGIPLNAGIPGPRYNFPQSEAKTSPDGKWEAWVNNFNVWVRPKGKSNASKDGVALSFDGSEGNYYALASLVWSPDSKMIAAFRVRPGYNRRIQYVESSPADQVQPKYFSMDYAKPGDELDQPQPVLFHVEGRKQFVIDNALFPNPYQLSRIEWRKNSRAFTFEYNQRGHRVYRIIEVDAATARPRAVISEEPKTFFCYSGKKYRHDLDDGREVIWMSERDGWNHLYLFDGATGAVKNQITRGQWVVRAVDKVDEGKHQIWFQASGMYPGKDPYFIHYYRINFDGTGLTALTEADGNHSVSFSGDMKYYVDTWSRVDQPTVSELRLTADKKVLSELERGDISELTGAGWRAPEVFTSTGRDGRTDIWGVIYRPSNFDASKKYPVIENIYAGPQGSFVPKNFTPWNPMQSLAELGFIVVQIDGMGTSNRSKAFHDVAWKNLGDAGFPDRILWHKAVAAKYPYYDITRVGIYGTSAGGQNSLGALLFHPEFYKACVSACGCHDNRMDKIWWNEQWMGWPLGPEYAAASNVDNAHKLQGKLLLILGEMDTNVDPASTMQVVNALVKADKTFDLLVIPGANHGPGGAYGEKKRNDFFVHHLLGVEPPDWNTMPKKQNSQAAALPAQQ
ncbi:MAG TPA: DPP IV N-terminal domain-containing protein [Blastocatellia bacterium]|nr:DPP IV N-terminal domain-containing protein [Blastocatellia bacterium]